MSRTPRAPVATLVTGLGAGLVLTATAIVTATATATATPAYAADSWRVPADARVTVVGHGYGHGHGLSQYGAEGAARAGLTYRQIVDFYYPGTQWGTADGQLRVLISADTTDDVVVRTRSGLKVRDLVASTVTRLPDRGADRWRLLAGDGGSTLVQFHRDGWRTWRRLDGEAQFGAGRQPLTLVTSTGERAYRGSLRSSAVGSGRDTVNVVGLNQYLRGVVPLEMPASWSPQAVRAQAVAARTYAAFERATPRADHYDLCDTTACQVYGGFDAEHDLSSEAVAATGADIVTWDGAPAFTQFSASSGGWTSAGSMPYLRAQADPYDDWSGNQVHDWQVTFTDNALERKFPRLGNLRRIVVGSRDGHGDWGGRVESVTLVGGRGRRTLSGDDLRWALGLRSTYLTFRVRAA